MAFKFITFFALVAIASAGIIPEYQNQYQVQQQSYAAPQLIKQVIQPAHIKQVEYASAPAEYEFSYEVHDEHTGDIKSQKESRHGDDVQGQYSLIDADGYRRTVTYQADEHNGFNAQVHREPTNIKISQPIQKVIAQPIQYYSQPAIHHAQTLQYNAQPAIQIAQPAQNLYASAPAQYSHGASHSTSLHSPHAQYQY